MFILILLLFVILLLSYLLLPSIIRAFAQARADQILHNKRSCTEKDITKCIRILTWLNKWFTINIKPDELRISLLCAMLLKIHFPHG